MDPTTRTILRQIETLGYAVSVSSAIGHCELVAVKAASKAVKYVVRSADGEAGLFQAACELARMVGLT